MAISINPLSVATSIAALSITGVTVKDVNAIPDSGQMITPVIFPRPNEFITSIEAVDQSFGSMGTQAQDFTYILNYVFLYCDLGSGEAAFTPYDEMLTKLIVAINVILNNDKVSGLVDMALESITGIGSIDDPAGNQYWGAFFSLRCLEYGQ